MTSGIRKTEQDYRRVGKDRNIEWVGKELPNNVLTKTHWRCPRGHVWETNYSSIQRKRNCPRCTDGAHKTKEDYHEAGMDRNIEWVGKELPKNTVTKTPWRCSRKHEWETPYDNIRRGTGCPHCADMVNGKLVSKLQRRICEMLGGTLNYPCGPYHIDVALLDKMIASEYDSWYYHYGRQEYDAKKDSFLLARGWKVLHIKSGAYIPTRQELDEAVARLEKGEKVIEIVLDDWGRGPTLADVLARERVDPWDMGPIPVSWNGGLDYVEYQQGCLWE